MSQLGIASIALRANLSMLGADLTKGRAMVLGHMQAMTAAMSASVLAGGTMMGGGVFNNFVEAASNAEVATTRLNSAFRATGGAAGFSRGQLDNITRSYANLSLQSITAAKNQVALLESYTEIRGEEFMRTLQASANVAAGTGRSITSVFNAIARAIENPIRGTEQLRRAAGITLSESVKHQVIQWGHMAGGTQMAQRILLNEIMQRYNGAAEAIRGTFTGQMMLLKAEFTTVREMIGTVLIPAVQAIVPALHMVGEWISNNLDLIQRFGAAASSGFRMVGAIIRYMVTTFENMPAILRQSSEHFLTFWAVSGLLLPRLFGLAGSILGISAGFAYLVSPLGIALTLLTSFGQDMTLLTTLAEMLVGVLNAVGRALLNMNRAMGGVPAYIVMFAAGIYMGLRFQNVLSGIVFKAAVLNNILMALRVSIVAIGAAMAVWALETAKATSRMRELMDIEHKRTREMEKRAEQRTQLELGGGVTSRGTYADLIRAFEVQRKAAAGDEGAKRELEGMRRGFPAQFPGRREPIPTEFAVGQLRRMGELIPTGTRLRVMYDDLVNSVKDYKAEQDKANKILDAGMPKTEEAWEVWARTLSNMDEKTKAFQAHMIELGAMFEREGKKQNEGLHGLTNRIAGWGFSIMELIESMGVAGEMIRRETGRYTERSTDAASTAKKFYEEIQRLRQTPIPRRMEQLQKVQMLAPVEFVRSIQTALERTVIGDTVQDRIASGTVDTARNTGDILDFLRGNAGGSPIMGPPTPPPPPRLP